MQYYNTTNERGTQSDLYTQTAKSQDERVLALFHTYKSGGATLIHRAYCRIYRTNTPITSIRRSINTLTKSGKLEKTDLKDLGSHGRPEYVWTLIKSI